MDQSQTHVLRTPRDAERVSAFLIRLSLQAGQAWEVIVRPLEEKRTIDQNKRYHAVVAEIAEQVVLDGVRYHPDIWKEQFKRWFIGSNEVQLPNGECITSGISTTTLSKRAFCDYMTQIEAWAAEQKVRFSEPARRYLSEWQQEAQRASRSRRFT